MASKMRKSLGGTIAAIYARYSSANQNDASIEQQVAECQEYADAHGLTVREVFEDRAISGRSNNRPGFQRMIRAANNGEFQVLLAYKSNRISRDMRSALEFDEQMFYAGVRVVYCKEEFGDNATGRFMLRMMMNMNQFYSENMSEDIHRGMKDSAAKGLVVGTIPYGYKKGPDRRYVIDEEAAAIVQEIYHRFLRDETLTEISISLNERGIRTGTGAKWNRSSFTKLLRNEKYTGVYLYDGVRIENGIPQIIERSVWEMVQQKLGDKQKIRRRHMGKNDYYLTGKLFCGLCEGAMAGVSGINRSGTKYGYYACMNRRLYKTCSKESVRKELIEAEVTRCIMECALEDETIEWIADSIMDFAKIRRDQSNLPTYEKQLEDVESQLKNLVSAIASGIALDEVKNQITELTESKDALKSLIAQEKAKNNYLPERDDIIGFLLAMRDGDYHDPKFQQMIIRDFVRKVYLYDDHFKVWVDFTDGNTSFERPLGDSQNDEQAEVRIGDSEVHHRILIRTPDPRNCADASEKGFVATWYFHW